MKDEGEGYLTEIVETAEGVASARVFKRGERDRGPVASASVVRSKSGVMAVLSLIPLRRKWADSDTPDRSDDESA